MQPKKEALVQEQKKTVDSEQLITTSQQQRLSVIENQRQSLEIASAIVRKNIDTFKSGKAPLALESILATL